MYSKLNELLMNSLDSLDLGDVSFSKADPNPSAMVGNVDAFVESGAKQTKVDEDQYILIEKILKLYLRHNLTFTCLQDVLELLNFKLESVDKFPTSKKLIMNMFRNQYDLFDVFFIIECEKCMHSSKVSSEDSSRICENCGLKIAVAESNFFVFIPLEQQIIKSVKENWSYITKFDTNSNGTTYSDAHDGKILKDLLEAYSKSDVNILSLTLNLDGANKFKSNVYSVWPLQMIQNYLPPTIRFLPDNIITCGMYYNKKKPNCFQYLLPLVNELDTLSDAHISIELSNDVYVFKPVVTHCSVDLPAKSMLQESKQFGGYDGCTYCDIVGELVAVETKTNKKPKGSKTKLFVRYTESDKPSKLRNEVETLKAMLAASKSGESINGIKDVSCLVKLQYFNIIKSFAVDYMHGCLLGVQKQILNFFCNSKFSRKSFYIPPKTRSALNTKLLAIRPTSNITRKPRSLDQRHHFKASEFRSLLLYYLPVILPGSVSKVYVDHVRLLSAAVYTLLKSDIPRDDVDRAEEQLLKFVRDHQNLFGKESMVMVVHLLKHLSDTVRNLGPLWCNSTFPFERNNGILLKLVNGTTDVLHQMSSKYNLSKSLPRQFKKADDTVFLGKCVTITEEILNVQCVVSLEIFDFSNVPLNAFKRIKLNNVIYTSLLYTRPKRTINYFIGLRDGTTIGMARLYFQHENKSYVLIEEFMVIENINHISKVCKTDKKILAPIEHINKKFIFMEVGLNKFITLPPNPYENE